MGGRAVYDAMVFFQWAVLPEGRQHRTVKALYDGAIRLCLSDELLNEVRGLLTRPELASKFPSLTPKRADDVLQEALKHADRFSAVPAKFSLPAHPKDDHLFNLAIEAQARYLVTWEKRLLSAGVNHAKELTALAPQLKILTPVELAAEL